MGEFQKIQQAARRRIQGAEQQIRDSLKATAARNPLAAEWERDRLVSRLETLAPFSREEADTAADRILGAFKGSKAASEALTVYNSVDFVGVAFLELGMRAARAVARVTLRDGTWQGSGFMVSDRLFLAAHHTIPSAEKASGMYVEFNYELDVNGQPVESTRFELAPSDFFLTEKMSSLDYTLVAVGPKVSGPGELGDFGWCPLSDDPFTHALGEVANIVQHPNGRHKEVVLRENRLVARLHRVLHYVADTEGGSSGSPVFNNEWKIIALHHAGEPWLETQDGRGNDVSRAVNEGILVSAIVDALREQADGLSSEWRGLLQRALSIGEP